MTDQIKVADVDELAPGDRKHIETKGKEITILNVDGDYYAVENFCPHMGGPVGNGRLSVDDDRRIIMCPFHEWRFDLESGDVVFPSKFRVMSYDVESLEDVSLEKYDVDVEHEDTDEIKPGVYLNI